MGISLTHIYTSVVWQYPSRISDICMPSNPKILLPEIWHQIILRSMCKGCASLHSWSCSRVGAESTVAMLVKLGWSQNWPGSSMKAVHPVLGMGALVLWLMAREMSASCFQVILLRKIVSGCERLAVHLHSPWANGRRRGAEEWGVAPSPTPDHQPHPHPLPLLFFFNWGIVDL